MYPHLIHIVGADGSEFTYRYPDYGEAVEDYLIQLDTFGAGNVRLESAECKRAVEAW